MPQTSLTLDLPYIQPAQAQKHVTHNEAIATLDALVQLSVQSRDMATPPVGGTAGDRYLVAAAATGDWAGHDHAIAQLSQNGDWLFFAPRTGWTAYVQDINAQAVFDGTAWVDLSPQIDEIQNAHAIGVGTTADAVNRLAIASEASLLTHAGGGHQLKINKAAIGETASLLFQNNWSARAEVGLAGTDALQIKTSDNGGGWNVALQCDPVTGQVQFPSGASTMQNSVIAGRFHCHTDNRWITFDAGAGTQSGDHDTAAGTGAAPDVSADHLGIFVQQGAVLDRLSGLLRTTAAEVSACDIQVCFQTGPAGAPWSSTGVVTRSLVADVTALSLDSGFQSATLDLGQFVAPQDGLVILFVRPVGTLTQTQHIVSAMSLGHLAAP